MCKQMDLGLVSRYRKVSSSRLSWLVAHLRIFRLFMKGKFDVYVLWPLAKRVQNWIVDRFTARDFTLLMIHFFYVKFMNQVPHLPKYGWKRNCDSSVIEKRSEVSRVISWFNFPIKLLKFLEFSALKWLSFLMNFQCGSQCIP